jgi:hypothetical protein
MARMKYNRPNGGYERLKRHLQVDATPETPTQRTAWATAKRNLRRQHEQANMSPEIRHATHRAVVQPIGNQQWGLWCGDCHTLITALTQEQAAIWNQLNPPRRQRSPRKESQ